MATLKSRFSFAKQPRCSHKNFSFHLIPADNLFQVWVGRLPAEFDEDSFKTLVEVRWRTNRFSFSRHVFLA